MTNGKCPTWFVVKWLTKHPTHTAKAPKTKEEKCFTWIAEDYAHVSKGILGFDVVLGAHNIRSDWTIYNERGKPVEFKRRRKLRLAGSVLPGQELSIAGTVGVNRSTSIADVFIRERKP